MKRKGKVDDLLENWTKHGIVACLRHIFRLQSPRPPPDSMSFTCTPHGYRLSQADLRLRRAHVHSIRLHCMHILIIASLRSI